MNLITKKEFIKTISDSNEFYFIGCVNNNKYNLEKLKKIIDNAKDEQLTYDKRYLVKIDYNKMVSKNGNGNSYLQFKPFSKYYRDRNIYYIVEKESTLIYYIKE